jgi:acyl carrier protein
VNKVKDEIKKILLENFNYDDKTNIFEIRKELNSLEFVKMIIMIEEKFNVNLSNEDTFSINTLIKKIEEK